MYEIMKGSETGIQTSIINKKIKVIELEVIVCIIFFIINCHWIILMFMMAGTYFEKNNRRRESMIQSVNEIFKVVFYGIIFLAADFIILKDYVLNQNFTSNAIMNLLVLGVSFVEFSSNGITLAFKKINRDKNIAE